MTTERIRLRFVESFPSPLEPELLYVSTRFSSAAHLCACGCGREVITPLAPGRWRVSFDGEVSVWPSIGSWVLPCDSHYVIDRGQIRWARAFSDDEVKQNQDRDTEALQAERVQLTASWWPRLLRRLGFQTSRGSVPRRPGGS